jgi:hypothetical protein
MRPSTFFKKGKNSNSNGGLHFIEELSCTGVPKPFKTGLVYFIFRTTILIGKLQLKSACNYF